MTVDQRLEQLRASVDVAILKGDHAGALHSLAQVWQHHSGPATAAFVNTRLSKLPSNSVRRVSVAVLRSFTIEPILPLLRAGAALNRLALDIHIGGFNTYAQEILDEQSPLYTSWQPDVGILAVQTRDVAPELWCSSDLLSKDELERIRGRVVGEFDGLISAFRRSSSAPLVVHSLERPRRTVLGLADRSHSHSVLAMVDRINVELHEMATATSDVYILDLGQLIAEAGSRNWYDERKWASMRMPVRSDRMADVASEWLRHIQPLVGRSAKVLIVDLDNTLWGGVVAEDGIDGILLGDDGPGSGYSALQRDIRSLSARGILLGICSKNNESDVREVFEMHPHAVLTMTDFVTWRINWLDKAENIRSIARELNVGLESIAFLDDSPAECDLVRQTIPDVLVLEMDQAPTFETNLVASSPYFERLSVLADDSARSLRYDQQRERTRAKSSMDSLSAYLESLEMFVSVEIMDQMDISRVAQLTQKTNQFNVTTRRYTESEIVGFHDSSDAKVFVTRSGDRFGDHGLIGTMIIRTTSSEWVIDTFLLSCRVIGRGVETAMLAALTKAAVRAQVPSIFGRFVTSSKNVPAQHFFDQHGFTRVPDGGSGTSWRYSLNTGPILPPQWIRADLSERQALDE